MVLCVHDEPLVVVEGAGQVGDGAEALVVPVVLAGQQDVQRVMELVGPLRVVAPLLERPPVADRHLGDHEGAAMRRPDALGQLDHDVRLRLVEDRVRGVEPESVDPVVAHPELGVLDRPLAHAALGVVERVAPEGVEAVGEVGPERRELGAGPDVVVDDVEDDREAAGVRGVDEAREGVRAAVGAVRRRGQHAVVAPAAFAGERRDGHQLDRGDAELGERVEARDRRVERALGRERADVEFVDDELAERYDDRVGAPRERPRVEHPRGPAQPARLLARAGVGEFSNPVEGEAVVLSRAQRQRGGEEAVAGGFQGLTPRGDARRIRGPYAHVRSAGRSRHRAQPH